jgi:hypothetical protein
MVWSRGRSGARRIDVEEVEPVIDHNEHFMRLLDRVWRDDPHLVTS